MKAIGFAEKFYTLWDIRVEENYATTPNGVHYLASITTLFTYLQNLSMDLDSAIEKAKKMGCINLEPSMDLRGKTNSWSNTIKCDKPKYNDFEFSCGRYEGQDIRTFSDLKYLLWYYGEYPNSFAAKRIAELDSFYIFDGVDLITKDALIYKSILKRELIAKSNFRVNNDDGKELIWLSVEFEPMNDDESRYLDNYKFGIDVYVDATDLNLVEKSYQGFKYWTPKGMRSFKGQKFTILENGKISIIK